MKEVMLDTSFILTCIRQKIDFFEELKLMGMGILIPEQVIVELEGKDNIGLSSKLLGLRKYIKLDLKTKDVDKGIIRYANENPNVFVATVDKGIKKKIENSLIVIREKKRLEII